MIMYFVFVCILLVRQASSSEPQDPQEQGSNSVSTRGQRVIRFVYHTVNPYPDVVYNIPESGQERSTPDLPEETDSDGETELAKMLIDSLENDLLHLHNQIGSKFDKNIVLQIVIRVDQKLSRLNGLNFQNLPSKVRSKIGKLKQNVDNLKLSILPLVKDNRILYEHLQNDGKQIIKSYKSTVEFKEWVNSLKNTLDSLKQSHIPGSNQKAIQRIRVLATQVSTLLGKAGMRDIPSNLQGAIKHFKINVHIFLNKIPLANQQNGNKEKSKQTEREYSVNIEEELKTLLKKLKQQITEDTLHKDFPNTFDKSVSDESEKDMDKHKDGGENGSLKTVEEWIKHLEDYLTRLETQQNSKIDERSILQLTGMISKISAKLENVDKSRIPQKLINKVNELENKVNNIKDKFSNLENETPSQQKEGENTPNIVQTLPDDEKIKSEKQTNALEDRLKQLSNIINTKPNVSIIMQVYIQIYNMEKELVQLEHTGPHPENLKNKMNSLHEQVISLKTEVVSLMYEQIQKKNSSIKEIQDWVNVLEGYLTQLERQKADEKNNYALLDINMHLQLILEEVQRIGLQNVPEELKNKIDLLQEKIKNTKTSSTGEKGKKDEETEINNEELDVEFGSERTILEDWISSLEENFESLQVKLMSQQFDTLKVSQLNSHADNILNQLQQVNLETISEDLKKRIQKLKDNIGNFKNELQITNNKKTNESEKRGQAIEIITQHINSLESYFNRLRSQINPKQRLVILIHTNTNFFEILNDLKQLEKVEDLPDDLKNKIKELFKNVTNNKNKLSSLIEKLKSVEMDGKKTPQLSINVSNAELVEELVLSIRKELESVIKRLKTEQDDSSLKNINIETHQLLIKLQKLKDKNVPGDLLNQIKKLEGMIEHIIVKIELLSSKNKSDDEDNNFERNHVSIDDSTVPVIDGQVAGFEVELKDIRKQLSASPDLSTIVHLYNQIHTILLNLNKLDLNAIPANIVIRIKNVLQNSRSLKDKIENAVTNYKQPIEKTVENDDVSNTPKETTVESQVQRLYYSLNNLRGLLISNLGDLSLTHIYIAINKILIELEHLELKEVPGKLLTKIKELIQFTKAFRNKVEPLVIKNVESKEVSNEVRFTDLENIIQQRVESLVEVLQVLKRVYLFEQDQSSVVQIYNKVEDILEELKRLLAHNIRESLKDKIRTFQEKAKQFKVSVESMIQSRILKPMELYIDELLQELETFKLSKKFCCSPRRAAKIFAIKTDLKILKSKIQSLTDYDFIRQLHYRIEAIVAKLHELKGQKTGFFDRAVVRLGKFLRDIL